MILAAAELTCCTDEVYVGLLRHCTQMPLMHIAMTPHHNLNLGRYLVPSYRALRSDVASDAAP